MTTGTTTGIQTGRTPGRGLDEVARLDRWLRARATPDRALGCTIRAADRDAAAEVAARHGYALRASAVEEPGALWAEFRPVD
ncbi:hypothetical protein GCM10023201_15080 [Actinomycetospora corticicola]|uniref:Uncharacterized protein n=1 Tax=Actinomycetospora corticicola TaxID=663602 RepID=A0A7Y9DVF4_9PSEU|nr:hypothetical protein [Actinomycetospora corticicola]NYD36134.1 hypothetical protein [Actinomycetospora corticicola]